MRYTFTGMWQRVNAAGTMLPENEHVNININAVESFRLPGNMAVELSAYYQSSRLSGINLQKGYGSLDIGIKKKLPGAGGAFTLSAGNILDLQDFIITTNYPETNGAAYLRVAFTQRTFRLTYSRNFGNDKLKQRKERTTGAEDEKGRVQ
jgi:Outer membrane protein beta-barrel family